MDIEKVREYCLKKRGVSEGLPFDDETLVFKVLSKMFCLVNLTPPHSINLKCDPETAIEIREKYQGVTAGYHMNKKYWITVQLDGSIKNNELSQWIDNSYNLVVKGLTKKQKEELKSF